MKIFFQIHYYIRPGEKLYVYGDIPELGSGDINSGVEMTYEYDGQWTLEVSADSLPGMFFYSYFMKDNQGNIIPEHGRHFCNELPVRDVIRLFDRWMESSFSNVFLTHKIKSPVKLDIGIRISSNQVPVDCHIALVGNSPRTGLWDPGKAIPLFPIGLGQWEAQLRMSQIDRYPIEYKFVIRKDDDHSVIEWEEGENRQLVLPNIFYDASKSREYICISCQPFRSRSRGLCHAGTAIPVFSLKSNKSWGIGDFGDLKKMADWAALTGQRVVQILPVNDTTMYHNWVDSYPYGGISIMALHPLYANIPDMCPKDSGIDLSVYEKERIELNKLQDLDYDKVAELKWRAIKDIFRLTGKSVMESAEYKNFYKDNKKWLRPYALFCELRDRYGTADFSQWGPYAHYSPVLSAESVEPDIHFFIQFHLDKQLAEAHRYMNRKGVILKGDIPIGITPWSVEAWTEPHLFNMDSQAGAPPDDFSVKGQNWGFPTYNWEVMEQDGYSWWKKRFTNMSRYFDAYRIDHILGFFRIWSIPKEQTQGLMGYFYPALPYTEEDLRSRGLAFDTNRMSKPFITDYVLTQMFAEQAPGIREHFLDAAENRDGYVLKTEFDTQRKITRYFGNLPGTPENEWMKEGLLALVSEVLFIPDPHRKGYYHPRISAQYNYSYKALDDNAKEAYNRIYNDFFYHRHNDFWYREAMKKLPSLLSATNMLCCAEDLGMIPACVPLVMRELSMLSLEVERMPKDHGYDFGLTGQYPYMSVCTTGTHDTSTLREWWEEDRYMTNRYYNEVLHEKGSAPYYCEPWVCRKIIENHLQSPSMLCILPWQDWMSVSGSLRREMPGDERINVPAIVPHYWRYRMHISLEDLLRENDFNRQIRDLIKENGR
ncbi:MAG: 4-alpha-glucanotransferase [Bacteroidales bacterium]|jgi:4-alpha-glucanotransferase